MISHKYKCIFIHIPKCAGTSITRFMTDGKSLSWKDSNYEFLHGWCTRRKFFMQHATAKQLLETELITEEQWNSYFKFTFVRNPFDRAISDFFWLCNDQKIRGTFKDYLYKRGVFRKYLLDEGMHYYRGDHQKEQTDFFDIEGRYMLDFVGSFENLNEDIDIVSSKIGLPTIFDIHDNNFSITMKRKHYSLYYNNSHIKEVGEIYRNDLSLLNYSFEDQRRGLHLIRKIL